jgi:hypothetical protein
MGGMAQEIECLASKQEALNSNLNTIRKREKEEGELLNVLK